MPCPTEIRSTREIRNAREIYTQSRIENIYLLKFNLGKTLKLFSSKTNLRRISIIIKKIRCGFTIFISGIGVNMPSEAQKRLTVKTSNSHPSISWPLWRLLSWSIKPNSRFQYILPQQLRFVDRQIISYLIG